MNFDFIRRFFYRKYKPENSGVLLGNNPLGTDYFIGSNSPISYKERLANGNWTTYAFDEEQQWCLKNGKYVDTMACVSFSDVNILQAQEYFLTGKKVQYSKRWIAKMSGTTPQGNYQYKVADTIRHFGLVLEQDYPTPASFSWDEYYADIPPVKLAYLKEKGQAWLRKWNVQYEFLQVSDPNLDYHLKHAPIQVIIPGHAVAGVYSPDQMMTVLDSYNPYFKKYSVANLLAAKKLILSPIKIQARKVGWKNHPEKGVYLPADTIKRFDEIQQKLEMWLPDYELDNTNYIIPTNKPQFN